MSEFIEMYCVFCQVEKVYPSKTSFKNCKNQICINCSNLRTTFCSESGLRTTGLSRLDIDRYYCFQTKMNKFLIDDVKMTKQINELENTKSGYIQSPKYGFESEENRIKAIQSFCRRNNFYNYYNKFVNQDDIKTFIQFGIIDESFDDDEEFLSYQKIQMFNK